MQSRIDDIRAAGAEVLAITVDSVEDNGDLAKRIGLDFPVLSDSEIRVIGDYGVLHRSGGMGGTDIARPAIFVIDGEGRVVWRDLTENWRIRLRPEYLLSVL